MADTILEEAQEIIFGARNASYGHPRDNFKDIARLWEGYLHKYGVILEPVDVANLMILMKVARINGNGYHRDSVVDIAGYAGTIERLQEPELPSVEEGINAVLQAYGSEVWEGQEPVDLDGVYNGGVVFEDLPEPRQWKSLNDVPWSVRLTSRLRDNEGDIWQWSSAAGWEWARRGAAPWIPGSPDASRHDESGPFVEIQ